MSIRCAAEDTVSLVQLLNSQRWLAAVRKDSQIRSGNQGNYETATESFISKPTSRENINILEPLIPEALSCMQASSD